MDRLAPEDRGGAPPPRFDALELGIATLAPDAMGTGLLEPPPKLDDPRGTGLDRALRHRGMIRAAPGLVVALMALPVAAGLASAVLPAFGYFPGFGEARRSALPHGASCWHGRALARRCACRCLPASARPCCRWP